MRGIILAAGRGSRMEEKTNNIPKCLLKIQNYTLLEQQIKALKDNQIDQISIVTGYLNHKIQNPFISDYFHNALWNKTNSIYSLLQADRYLTEETCVVSYSDIFYSSNCVYKLIQSNEDLVITYDPKFLSLWEKRFLNPLDDLETFRINHESYILEIGEKVQNLDSVQGQYMGLIKIQPQTWAKIKKILFNLELNKLFKLDFTSLFQILLKEQFKIKAVSIDSETWGEVDTSSDLSLYSHFNIT